MSLVVVGVDVMVDVVQEGGELESFACGESQFVLCLQLVEELQR